VFDRLELKWKEPHERLDFDSVEGKISGREEFELTKKELKQEGDEHQWIE
jgi:hypothetical protein